MKASITYMRGGRIPQDVIKEDIPLPGIQHMREALVVALASVPTKSVPAGTEQITVVIWNDRMVSDD